MSNTTNSYRTFIGVDACNKFDEEEKWLVLGGYTTEGYYDKPKIFALGDGTMVLVHFYVIDTAKELAKKNMKQNVCGDFNSMDTMEKCKKMGWKDFDVIVCDVSTAKFFRPTEEVLKGYNDMLSPTGKMYVEMKCGTSLVVLTHDKLVETRKAILAKRELRTFPGIDVINGDDMTNHYHFIKINNHRVTKNVMGKKKYCSTKEHYPLNCRHGNHAIDFLVLNKK